MVTRGPLTPAERVTIRNPSFRFRDPRGRFRAGTPAELFALDTLDAQAEYYARRAEGSAREYSVWRGARTGREFAVRRGAIVPLDGPTMQAQVQTLAGLASVYLLGQLRLTSPVDTGLLRSQWRIAGNAVENPTPYTAQTEYVNRSSRGYVRRAVAKTMRQMARQGVPGVRSRTVTVRL